MRQARIEFAGEVNSSSVRSLHVALPAEERSPLVAAVAAAGRSVEISRRQGGVTILAGSIGAAETARNGAMNLLDGLSDEEPDLMDGFGESVRNLGGESVRLLALPNPDLMLASADAVRGTVGDGGELTPPLGRSPITSPVLAPAASGGAAARVSTMALPAAGSDRLGK